MEENNFEIWKFLAGIGIFLYGMHMLERALKDLAGKSFRNLLYRFTNRSWKGVITGTVTTAVLQSSSLVTLMVLAFLGVRILSLQNAIGVILGANLGTTFTAWIVATIGFKLSVADFSLPFLAIGSLSVIFLNARPHLQNLGYFCVGFGFLFLGLDFMKTSIEAYSAHINLEQYSQYGLWVFFVLGIIITALIQSSSAMTVIVLSAINSEVISIMEAAVMIAGTNVGTTVTVGLGAIKGNADKKRLGLAHFTFNFVTGVLVFIFVRQLIDLTIGLTGVREPLMTLVIFNTLFNVLGILLFFPFLNFFEKWLSKRFVASEPAGNAKYIKHVAADVPEVALTALEMEVNDLLTHTVFFIRDAYGVQVSAVNNISPWRKIFSEYKDPMSKYKLIKSLEDELTEYHILLQEQPLTEAEGEKLIALMHRVRQLVYAAKETKDIMHNIAEVHKSDDTLAHELMARLRAHLLNFTEKILENQTDSTEHKKARHQSLINENESFYHTTISELYVKLKSHKKEEIPVSTLTNIIRHTISSLDNVCMGLVHVDNN